MQRKRGTRTAVGSQTARMSEMWRKVYEERWYV